MIPAIITRRKSALRLKRNLRYDGITHKYIPVKVKLSDYHLIGENKEFEYYTLNK